jgi:hypothetical protein
VYAPWTCYMDIRALYTHHQTTKHQNARLPAWLISRLIKGPQTTPTCNQNPPDCYMMHIRTKPGCFGCCKIIKSRVGCSVLCFEAKSATEKFDLTDTAQSENTIRCGAIFHPNALVCSLNTFSSAPGPSSVELFT